VAPAHAAPQLQDDGRLYAAGARLLGDNEAEFGICDDHRRREQALAGHAVEYLLKGRRRPDQRAQTASAFFRATPATAVCVGAAAMTGITT
jgi:hypothetical protein